MFHLNWGVLWKFFVYYDLLSAGIKKVVWSSAIVNLNKAVKLSLVKMIQGAITGGVFSGSSTFGTCDC